MRFTALASIIILSGIVVAPAQAAISAPSSQIMLGDAGTSILEQAKAKGHKGNRGRHLGWTRGKHKGWAHSRHRH